jgi:TolA-binding protein
MLKPRKRLTRKQLKEDKLLTTVIKVQTFLEKEWKRLTVVSGSILVVALFVFYMVQRNDSQEQEAVSNLYEVELQYIEKRDFNEQLVQALQNIMDHYENTASAEKATFHLANTYYQLGDYHNAEIYFQKYIDDYKSSDLLSSSSLAGIAACSEQTQDYSKASEYYLRAVNEYPDEFIIPDNMLGAARTLILAGKKNEAFIQCQNLIEKYPNSSAATDAEIILARQ